MSINDLIKNLKRDLLVTPYVEMALMKGGNVLVPDDVAQFVVDEITTPQRDRTKTFSASSSGFCKRRQVFQYLDFDRLPITESRTNAIFQDGTWRHIRWQALLLKHGILTEVERSIEVPEFRMTGTIDGIGEDEAGEFGWELKGINSRGYRRVLDSGPQEKHLLQIHAYMIGSGLDRWSLVYECKDTQEFKEFVVRQDEATTNRVLDDLHEMNSAINNQTLPPMLDPCIDKEGTEYRYCPFREQCPTAQFPIRRIRIKKN